MYLYEYPLNGRKQNGKLTGKTSNFIRNFLETDSKAVFGHSWKKLIAVQFTSAGNFRERRRNVAPTGEKHSTIYSYIYYGFVRVHDAIKRNQFLVICLEIKTMITCMRLRWLLNAQFSRIFSFFTHSLFVKKECNTH